MKGLCWIKVRKYPYQITAFAISIILRYCRKHSVSSFYQFLRQVSDWYETESWCLSKLTIGCCLAWAALHYLIGILRCTQNRFGSCVGCMSKGFGIAITILSFPDWKLFHMVQLLYFITRTVFVVYEVRLCAFWQLTILKVSARICVDMMNGFSIHACKVCCWYCEYYVYFLFLSASTKTAS